MLAYTFWHWKRESVSTEEYQRLLGRFHAALAADPSHGFRESRSFAIDGAPWANGGGAAYEDWYLLDDSLALDRLNDAAISNARQAPHDAAAAAALGGTAGLFRLRLGAWREDLRHARWFAKPAALSYAQMFDAMQPVILDGRGALWGRQMTLGPSPEFCLQSDVPVELPPAFDAIAIHLRPVVASRASRRFPR